MSRVNPVVVVLGVALCAGCSNGKSSAPAAVAILAPAALDFGSQPVGQTSAAKDVTLSDTGSAALAIAGIEVGPDYAQVSSCGGTLGPGASCTIQVTVTPQVSGPRPGTLVGTNSTLTEFGIL